MNAHLASCAAGMQQKFHEFMAIFWEKGFNQRQKDPESMSDENILKMAAELELDMSKFRSDMSGEECQADIKGDMAELNRFGVSGTPSFFINGKSRGWSGPERFTAMIETALADVAKSEVPGEEYYAKVVMNGEKKFVSRRDAEKRDTAK